jgi:beta-N-acetylhexosaminidase
MLPIDRVCGQLIVGGYLGDRPTDRILRALSAGHLGGAILFKRNLPSIQAAWESCRALREAAVQGSVPWLCLDEEGGRVRRLPAPFVRLPAMLELAAAGDEAVVERAAALAGRQLAAIGFNLNLAPVLDVNTNPANPVIGDRAFGAEPAEASRMAMAWLRGLRSAGLCACGKHFPGHGDTSVDSHIGLPRVDWGLDRLDAVELVPFKAAIAAKIDCIMSAHVVCTAIDAARPATLSPAIATGILRERLGYQGVLLSDDLEMKAIAGQSGIAEAAVRAVAAGCDAVLICSLEDEQDRAHEALVREAERSETFRARCEQAVERSLTAKAQIRAIPASSWLEALDVLQGAEACVQP